MVVHYISTRGDREKKSSAEAIVQGLAADGGLFVPSEIPQVDLRWMQSLMELSYEERAERVLGKFLADYTEEELSSCVQRAYASGKFDAQSRVVTRTVGDFSVLELWHGPTSAFKDMALQMLPQLMRVALKKTGEDATVLILVATSGDTGKAALEGFADVEQTKVMVFYPADGVSAIQRLQMVTQQGGNVSVVAVKGNFDDAQTGVKEIFSDAEFSKVLLQEKVKLSSANSINWGRLAPQIVYYFSAYADLLTKQKIALGDAVTFCVPTGNFGDILAGYYAREMGLPMKKLICASNQNNVLTDFIRTGTYDRNRAFYKTISPSMDILISSNLERLLYHLTRDAEQVAMWMQDLRDFGRYTIDAATKAKMDDIFLAGFASDTEATTCMREVFEENGYVIDPHTAVAWKVAEMYEKYGESPVVVLSTASPYKFNESVLTAIEGNPPADKEAFHLLDALAKHSKEPIPKGLDSLRTATPLYTQVVEKQKMKDAVLMFAQK